MPLSASINGVTFDSKDAQTIARFTSITTEANTEFSGPAWNGLEVVLQSGMVPGHATVLISLSQSNDEKMPSVCAINSSKVNDIKIGDLCAIYAVIQNIEVLMFTGYVMDVVYNLTKDICTISLQDHRHALSGVPIIGSFVADAYGTTNTNQGGNITFAHGLHAYCNPNNEPNCTLGWDPIGQVNVPCFCQPTMGLVPGNLIQSSPGVTAAFTPVVGKACYWSPKTFWQYLWWAYTSAGAKSIGLEFGVQTAGQNFVFTQVAEELVWDSGLEAALVGPLNAGINSVRKCVSADYHGRTLLEVLSNICLMYGQYGLNVTPYSPTEGRLEIVPTLPQIDQQGNTNGIDLIRYVDGPIQGYTEPGISGGTFGLMGKDMNTRLFTSGETVYMEARVDLVSDFSDTQVTQWSTGFKNNGVAFDLQLAQSNENNPSVFCWYRINPSTIGNNTSGQDLSIQKGTSEAGYPLAYIGRPPLAKLLSNLLASSANFALITRMSSPYPVIFETCYDPATVPPANQKWIRASNNSDFTVESNGRIRLEGLRNISLTGDGTFKLPSATEFPVVPVKVIQAQIRATFAIPLDHAVRAARRLASDVNASVLPIQTNPDSDRVANSYWRAAFENLSGDGVYSKWLRNKSYPTPQTGPTDMGLSTPIRDDTPYLLTQTQIKSYQSLRLPKSGQFIYPYILPDFKPGISLSSILNRTVSDFTTFDVDAIINRVTFKFGDFQSTELGLG